MPTYHCPHCSALMRHKPELAGDCVTCSKCGGRYYEPTDPLPGVKPQIAPPEQERPPASSGSSPFAPAASSGKNAGAAAAASSPVGKELAACQLQDMVAELERRGLHALLIAWPPAAREQASMAFSQQLGRAGANDMLLEIAFHLIGSRWPELHQLLQNYRKQSP